MVMLRGGFANLLKPGFVKVAFDEYKARPLEYPSLVSTPKTPKRAYYEDFQFTGFGALRLKPEGSPFPLEDPMSGNTVRYKWDTFALGFRITMEMMDDDLYGIVGNRLSQALGRSARNNAEIIAHSPFNNAFNTAFASFNTGESLVSPAHTIIRGGTLSNRSATDADLDLISLQAALEHFHALTDESGIQIAMKPKTLVSGIGQYWIANQLLKSQFLPGGNQNDINQIAKEGINYQLSHYLTDPDAWFLLGDNVDVRFHERRPFQMTSVDDFNTGDAIFRGLARRGAGWGDWRGVYGSAGT